MSVILVVSLLFNAPLEQPVNVMHPPNPAKAPWYFLGLQEMVSYSAFWGGVGIPGRHGGPAAGGPVSRPQTHGVGRWFAKERLLANTMFLYAGDPERDLHHHRHLLPRAELDFRFSILRKD